MPAPPIIHQLVERFRDNRAAYKAGDYKEAEVRQEFIDPFFEALGWDMANRLGYAEAYKDVIHEHSLKIGDATKAPDYCFQIGGKAKFYLEAKKPAVNIKEDISPAYQLRRYAWSAKLPLSVLTDFEEFAVYDCRVKPNQHDKASVGRIRYLTFEEYVEQWDELAGIFSKEAVLKGSFDKYADTTKGKRGTTPVDEAFLAEMEEWRKLIAQNLALRNQQLDERGLNFAVQMTLNRIIFLRMCEDRGIETYGRLQGLLAQPEMYRSLVDLYRQADERYNSGLFHFQEHDPDHFEKPDTLTPNLTLDDKPLKEIIGSLYYPDSPYEFSVISPEILGQVYEQFLGKVIHLTKAHRAQIEDKPEVRKAGGVYYTPGYIVEYIVKNTVGRLLGEAQSNASDPRDSSEPRTSVSGTPPAPSDTPVPPLTNVRGSDSTTTTPTAAAKLKILDPACGSGSFLLGAYQYLLDWHLRWYVADGPEKHAKGKRPAVFQSQAGWKLTTAERKRILVNNIYGVDIDRQAVEVTKLALLLKVLEDESQETLEKQLQFLHERALPDLGSNIKCGNSLIGPDSYIGQQTELFDEETQYRINAFDWNAEFPQVFPPSPLRGRGAGGEGAGGFDAVIGNPPYIRIHRIGHEEADYIFNRYEGPTSKTDLSLVFVERAFSLASQHGWIGFICTSQWLATDYGKNMRRMLSDGRVHEIVDFGSLPVFAKASTYPAVFILSRDTCSTLSVKRMRNADQLNMPGIEAD